MSNLFLKLKSRLNAAPSSTDMTQGEPWKLLTSFALPVLFSQIFQQLYNTADSLIVGRTLGMEALAAVSSSGNLIFLLVSFFMGMSMQGTSAAATGRASVSQCIRTSCLR